MKIKFTHICLTLLLGCAGSTYAADISSAPNPVAVAAAAAVAVPAARGPALDLSVEAAQTALAACTAIQQTVAVSVLDSAGVPKALLAADGASARGVASSNSKAQTALTFKAATSALSASVKTDPQLAEKIAANSSFNIRAGGVLLVAHGEIIGAIGVGGARGSEKDEACALAGIAKIQDRLEQAVN